MPTPRKGETREECRVRENERKRNRKKWHTISRRLDKEGNVLGSLQKPAVDMLVPKARFQMRAVQAAAEAFAAELPRIGPAPQPEIQHDDWLVAYPIGDHHMGMLSWGEETGADYDLKIAEASLSKAFDYLITSAMPAAHALLVVLGDFFHYDGMKSITAQSGNFLDSDTRYPNMIRAGVRVLRRVVDALLRRHTYVHMIIEPGNHDEAAIAWLAILLAALYEEEPRATVDLSPSHYHYYHFGRVLVGVHHGHGPKPPQLPGIMAADQPEAWGASMYRYFWTGHVHSQRVFDYPGCVVESFRILPPGDAWAVNKGFRSHRGMVAPVIHRRHGERHRHILPASLLEEL